MAEKILLGVSGGVDSAYSAYLLKEKGYEVTGVFLKVHDFSDSEDAKIAAEQVGIPLIIEDCREEFTEKVIADFISEYSKGRTPNPCVMCNRTLKIAKLCEIADRINADYIATGHYVKIKKDKKIGRYYPVFAEDSKKDQSYVLWRLTQTQFSKFIAPLSGENKSAVKEEAARLDLKSAQKRESQEICFIPDNDYVKFIEERTGKKFPEGDFIDKNGQILGKHGGIIRYTIGQRRGLGISLGVSKVVISIDAEKNTVTLGDIGEEFSRGLVMDTLNFCMLGENDFADGEYLVKTRYGAKPVKADVSIKGDYAEVIFQEPARAVTSGQSCVAYKKDADGEAGIAFGGIIKSSF